MSTKLITGCAYCERDDAELRICCHRHGRLVCGKCTESPAYRLEHQPVAA